MSPRTFAQYEEIRENKKALILDAALHLFAESGYHGTSISQIAKRAKISKGLLYNYFESKEALLRTLVLEGFDEIASFFDENNDGTLTDQEFEFFIHKSFSLIEENLAFWKLYFSLLVQPVVMDILTEQIMEYFHPLFVVLTQYFISKKINNPEAEVRFFAGLLDGIAIHYILDPANFPLKESKERIIKMYINK